MAVDKATNELWYKDDKDLFDQNPQDSVVTACQNKQGLSQTTSESCFFGSKLYFKTSLNSVHLKKYCNKSCFLKI